MKFVHDSQPQSVYDAFNEYIFSTDRNLFGKIMSKIKFCEMTKNIPGDVVELGVFKGSGMMAWLKTLSHVNVNYKKVVGFDFFDADAVVSSVKTADQEVMKSLFEDRGFDPKGTQAFLAKTFVDAGYHNYDLVKGDVVETVAQYVKDNPGFRASIVNFDLDVEDPTEACLDFLWNRVVRGGVVVFDEYAFGEWTESNAVDRFITKHDLTLHTTGFYAPSAYIVKE